MTRHWLSVGVLCAFLLILPTPRQTAASPAATPLLEPTLFLSLPESVLEGTGFLTNASRIILSSPTTQPLEIHLTSSPLLDVPATVVVPAGHQSVRFSLSVLDDDRVNPPHRTAHITASAPGWISPTETILILDNESTAFTLSGPELFVEGVPATVSLQLEVPRDHPVTVTFASDNPNVPAPENILLPPGVTTAELTLLPEDNSDARWSIWFQLCAQVDSITGPCLYRAIADDEVQVHGIFPIATPSAAWTGELFDIAVHLNSLAYIPPSFEHQGTLSVLPPTTVQWSEPTPTPNFKGGWMHLQASVNVPTLNLHLVASHADFTQISSPIHILDGFSRTGPILDIVAHPISGHLLLSTGTPQDPTGLLLELDPQSGEVLRQLPLPKPGTRLAIDAMGTKAWIASPQDSLQVVHLDSWQWDQEFLITHDPSDPLTIVALAVVPGTTNLVLTLLGSYPLPPDPTLLCVAFDSGQRLPSTVPIQSSPFLNDLLPGRVPGEVFVRAHHQVLRLNVSTEGPQPPTHQADIGDSLNLVLDGDRLLAGNGAVLSSDTLEPLQVFPVISWFQPPLHLVVPVPQRDMTAFIDGAGEFSTYSNTSLERIHTHSLPENPLTSWAPYRFLRCGDHRFAHLANEGNLLRVWSSPLASSNPADLEIHIDGPRSYISPPDQLPQATASIPWTITVTNHGPHRAESLTVSQDTVNYWHVGPLDPGASFSMVANLSLPHYGMHTSSFQVSSPSPDPRPDNNHARAEAAFTPSTLPSTQILSYALQHVVPNASKQRLFLAVRHFDDHPEGAVLVLNPHIPAVESVIPIPNPRHIAVVPDGSAIYVLTGDSQIIRWNLATQSQDASWTTEDPTTPIVDLTPLLDGTGRLAVLTRNRLMILQGSNLHSQSQFPLAIADLRRLMFGDNLLWLIYLDRIRSFRITETSILPYGTDLYHNQTIGPFPSFSDDQRLYFHNGIFDFASRNLILQHPPYSIQLSDPAHASVFGFNGHFIQRRDSTTFDLLGSQRIAAAYPKDYGFHGLIQWGDDGLAALVGDQIVLFRSSLLHSHTADLSARIDVTPSPLFMGPFSGTVTLSNAGPLPASNAHLLLNLTAAELDLSSTPFPSILLEDGRLLELGDIASGQSLQIPFSGDTHRQPLLFVASIHSATDDPVPANNTARFDHQPPPYVAEGIVHSWSVPPTVIAGEEYEVSISFTNYGPDTIPYARLWLWDLPGTTILSTSMGILNNQVSFPDPFPLDEPITVRLRLRSDHPGLYHLRAELTSSPELFLKPDPWAPIAVLPPPGSPVDTFNHVHGLRFDWHPDRHQILSTWNHGISLIDPHTLQPIRTLPTTRPPVRFILSQDLQSVWAADASHRLQKIDLDGTRSYPTFAPFESPFFPRGSFTTVAAQPDLVIVGGLRTNQTLTVTAYDNGVPRPHSLTLQGVGPFGMTTSPEDRIFLVAGPRLHELLLLPEGIFPLRELDWPDAWIHTRLSFAGPYLFGNSYANPIDPPNPFDAPVPIHLPYPYSLPIADARSQRLYMISSGLNVLAIDAPTLRPLWNQSRSAYPHFNSGELISCGDLGILAQLNEVTTTLLRHPDIVPLQLELQATLSPTNHPGAPVPLQLQATLHNTGPQLARTAYITTTLSPGLRFLDPDLQASRSWTTNLQDFLGDFPFQATLEPTESGPQWVRIQVIAEPSHSGPPTTNELELPFQIPPPPYFYLEDAVLVEGPDYPALHATLTRPAPVTLQVLYHVQSDNADPWDFGSPASFVFPTGSRHAEAHFLYPNQTPSLDKDFLLTFDQGSVVPIRTSARVTLLDEDSLWVQPRTEQMLELNKPTNTFVFPLQLSHPFPLPIEVHYQLTPGTAIPHEDYLPQNGTLLFEPGTTLLTFPITVIGDTQFEPTETLFIHFTSDSFPRFLPTRSTLNIRNDDPPPSPVLTLQPQPDGSFHLRFHAEDRIFYLIQVNTNLATGDWRSIPPLVTGTGESITIPIPPSTQDARYFRIRTN